MDGAIPQPARWQPDLSMETAAGGRVAGIDEAGRGPWAGPVVAAAVILDPANIPAGLDDSKRLSATIREHLSAALLASTEVGVGAASVHEIDQLNILQASLLAMRRAVAQLAGRPVLCLVDGNRDPGLGCATELVVKGDQRSLSIAAASIVAKTVRDRLMRRLAARYPDYEWEKNAGYGVPAHRHALELVGISPHHRRSFRPILELTD